MQFIALFISTLFYSLKRDAIIRLLNRGGTNISTHLNAQRSIVKPRTLISPTFQTKIVK